MENLAALANAYRRSVVARLRLYSWLMFEVLAGNSDAHLKNLCLRISSHVGHTP